MKRSERDSFDRRFRRGLSCATVDTEVEVVTAYAARECPSGCGRIHLLKEGESCPWCSPPSKYALKNIRMSVEATTDDSTNPQRIRDGSAGINMALPDVPGEVLGKDAYGMTKRRMRPVHNNEVSSGRKLRELAKRAGLSPLEGTPKRAVGGR